MKDQKQPAINGGMTAKQDIINSIIKNAEAVAENILNSARAEAEKNKAEALGEISAQKEKTLKKAQAKAAEISMRKNMLCRLDNKKFELAEKQRLVDKVYAQALSRLKNLSDNEYKQFVQDKIAQHAEPGDQVIAGADDKRLDTAWLDAFNRKNGLNLSFLPERHNEDGGVILRNEKYDKRLTLAALIKDIRERTENEITKRLFE